LSNRSILPLAPRMRIRAPLVSSTVNHTSPRRSTKSQKQWPQVPGLTMPRSCLAPEAMAMRYMCDPSPFAAPAAVMGVQKA